MLWPACGSDLANWSSPSKYCQSMGCARCTCPVQFHYLGTRLKLAVETRSEHWCQTGLLLGSSPALGVPHHIKTKLCLAQELDAALALNCPTSHSCGHWRVFSCTVNSNALENSWSKSTNLIAGTILGCFCRVLLRPSFIQGRSDIFLKNVLETLLVLLLKWADVFRVDHSSLSKWIPNAYRDNWPCTGWVQTPDPFCCVKVWACAE